MIKKIMLSGLFFVPFLMKAQVTITVQLPPAGFVQKDQLWNMMLINNKEDLLELNIKMNMQNALTGQTVMSATTGTVFLGKGLKVITGRELQPIMYNYVLPGFNSSFVPMGAYLVCYQVIRTTLKGDEPMGDECIRVNIDPLSPPLLNMPADKSELDSKYPQFFWMPPAPFDMFTNLSYDMLVTEVLNGQSAVEAIQYNLPLYSANHINQPSHVYPSSFTSLDTGKIYAWQVIAKNELDYAAKSEVWTFKIKPPQQESFIVQMAPYIKMKKDNPEKGMAPNDILKLSYLNETTDSTASVVIKDPATSAVLATFKIPLQPGENLVKYDLKKLFKPEKGVLYEAQIINSRKEKWVMRFDVFYYDETKK